MKKLTFTLIMAVMFISMCSAGDAQESDSHTWTDTAIYTGLRFRNVGPALMSGRISDIAIHPEDKSIWYIAVGSGGVWKTVNAGTTWTPVFDAQPVYSIGCVTIDSLNPDNIWVGTGENVSGRHVGWGDGIYLSRNGGRTWENMGLKKSQHISKIQIDPRESKVIHAAVEGPLWSSGGERGVFTSRDGGQTWEPSLEISPDTGVTDIALDPENPDILYAAAYHRRRSVAAFLGGGPESGIYKSEDGGMSWRELKVGLPGGDKGRIGLAVSPIKPNVVYATIEAAPEVKGFYRSTDRGESWTIQSSYTSSGTGPHYYQEIFADPNVFDRVYQMDVWLHVTQDGGRSFHPVGEATKHSDNHALAFDPDDPEFLLVGSDGGLYSTYDRGGTWLYYANLPLTQFYKMALDNDEPFYNLHGGTQDNCSQAGPSRTLNQNGIFNHDWYTTTGADGYATAIDPEDPDIIYAETQNGNLNRYDRGSGELVDIRPQPEPGEDAQRFNWDAPVIISPHSHRRLYFAAQYVYRSEDRGNSWTRISPDLTRNVFRLGEPIMGKTWSVDALWDHGAMSMYSSITTLAESSLVEGLLYAGTDDGLIQVTEDGGENWRRIEKIPGVPGGYFVNDIRASKFDGDTVYAAVDNHKTGDLKPYLLKSTDRGRSWASLNGDLPEQTIVWAITQDHVKKELLFIGTEFGIYFTLDQGEHWAKLQGGVPTISFRDLEVQERESDLVGASFGRGFFILDDYSPLRHVTQEALAGEAVLFPVKDALRYIEKRPFNLRDKSFLGDGIFLAPNPPFGAIFTYYLKETLKTAQDERRKKERELDKAGEPVTFPGWEVLEQEQREEKPAVVLTVKDASGQVVRRLSGPAGNGIHRVAWDLGYPDLRPTRLQQQQLPPWADPPRGPMAAPGEFTVELSKVVDGETISLGEPQAFTMKSLGLNKLEEKDREALLNYQKKVGELQRAMAGVGAAAQEMDSRLQFMKKALLDTPAGSALLKTARELELRLADLMTELYGDYTRSGRSEPSSPSLMRRLDTQLRSTSPVTETNRRGYEIAADGFEVLLPKLRQLIEVDLPKLEEEMEAAGAPWTPGRALPKWKKK
ncbi:MAG: hypothetical protein WBB73_06405 [Candidatus Aminicenantaceae bacterium]